MIDQLKGFDQYINKTMKDWKVQGTAIAIIKDNEIVHCQGYGKRDVNNNQPVDANTCFAIGSASKAFTTFAMGILVDRGLLEWDKPVRDYLPTFKLYDPFATERMTPRDLVCHRSGLPRHDLMWYGSSKSRKELVDRLQYLEPNKDFRTYLQYQNLMYMTAGYLIEVVSGLTWEQFTEKEIFLPLGMSRSNISVDPMQQLENISRPYQEEKKKVKEIPYRNIDAVGPAGSINSTLVDMLEWVRVHLNDGKAGEAQIISKTNLDECHKPNMVISNQFFGPVEKFGEYVSGAYGLGWFVSGYRGHKLIHHGGNIDGFSSLISFLPDQNLGMVVLTNMNGTAFPFPATFGAYDRLLGLEEIPWNKRLKDAEKEMEAGSKQGKKKSAEKKVRGTRPSHPLEAYVGEYEHPGYGVFSVSKGEKGLEAGYNGLTFTMKHYHYDFFELTYALFDITLKVSFATDVHGNITSLSAPLEPSVKDIVFVRRPDTKLSEKSFLEQFVGEYELMGQTMAISLHGDSLFAALPGQAELELEPYQDTTFKVKNVPAITLEFKLEKDKVTAVEVNQGGMVFEATRKA